MRETGTGQQVAQLHDRYVMIMRMTKYRQLYIIRSPKIALFYYTWSSLTLH